MLLFLRNQRSAVRIRPGVPFSITYTKNEHWSGDRRSFGPARMHRPESTGLVAITDENHFEITSYGQEVSWIPCVIRAHDETEFIIGAQWPRLDPNGRSFLKIPQTLRQNLKVGNWSITPGFLLKRPRVMSRVRSEPKIQNRRVAPWVSA